MLTCPAVTNTYRDNGGTFGPADGRIRTAISSLTGVGGNVSGTWYSPGFTYGGVNGQQPVEVGFTISQKSNLGSLLSVAGNSATTTVELVNLTSGGVATRIIHNRAITPTQSWTRIPVVNVNVNDLIIGHNYLIRITSRFEFGAQVVPGGGVDYDDILLFARDTPSGGDGGGGGGGDNGDGVGGLIGGGNSAFFDGRNLFFKLKCLGVHKNGKCRVRATALTKKRGGKRVTFPIQRKVKAKKGKIVRARVRFQFRDELERRNNILIRSKITTGSRKNPDKEKVKFKKLRLIHRGD
jgi:hypothetical protein